MCQRAWLRDSEWFSRRERWGPARQRSSIGVAAPGRPVTLGGTVLLMGCVETRPVNSVNDHRFLCPRLDCCPSHLGLAGFWCWGLCLKAAIKNYQISAGGPHLLLTEFWVRGEKGIPGWCTPVWLTVYFFHCSLANIH